MTGNDQPLPERFPYASWGAGAAAIATLVALVIGFFLAVPILIFDGAGEGEDLSTTATAAAQLATALGFILVPLWLAARPGGGLIAALRRLGFRSFDSSAIGWMVVAAVSYFVFTVAYASLILEPEQSIEPSDFGALPVQVFLIVICASFGEEICFRGMLFGGLRLRYGRIAAALLSALPFGLLHAMTGLEAVPPLIVFGLALALLYEKTGSLWPPILLHGFNNSLALIALQTT